MLNLYPLCNSIVKKIWIDDGSVDSVTDASSNVCNEPELSVREKQRYDTISW